MRLWRDEAGSILTDEQVLRHVAAFGSLSAAVGAGDIELISEVGSDHRPSGQRMSNRQRLNDYLDVLERD